MYLLCVLHKFSNLASQIQFDSRMDHARTSLIEPKHQYFTTFLRSLVMLRSEATAASGNVSVQRL